jgi:hypothetical protein
MELINMELKNTNMNGDNVVAKQFNQRQLSFFLKIVNSEFKNNFICYFF